MTHEDARLIGLAIRTLLLTLRADDHSAEEELRGVLSHKTDWLRSVALKYAGICSLEQGALAPACSCGWSEETGIER